MSNLSSYPIRSFSETQQFLVNDPATGTASRVRASDLVSYITPRLNSVIAESTRLAAENTDYVVGEIIQTSGAESPGDNFAAVYLVVAAGEGDFPMINGNELLVIRGDELLREQLAEDPSVGGNGVLLVNGAVQRVSSRTEMKAYDVPVDYQFSLEEGGRSGLFVVKAGTPPSDPQEGIYVVLANGNYAERIYNEDVNLLWFGAAGDGSTDDTTAFQEAARLAANRFEHLFVPAKDYVVSGEVDLNPDDATPTGTTPGLYGCYVVGESFMSTRILFKPSAANSVLFNIRGISGNNTEQGVSNIKIEAFDNTYYRLGIGVKLIGACFALIDNVYVNRLNDGFLVTSEASQFTEFNYFRNCRTVRCVRGFALETGDGTGSFHGTTFERCVCNIGIDGGDKGLAIVGSVSNNVNLYNSQLNIKFFGFNSVTCFAIHAEDVSYQKNTCDITAENNIEVYVNNGSLGFKGRLDSTSTVSFSGNGKFTCDNFAFPENAVSDAKLSGQTLEPITNNFDEFIRNLATYVIYASRGGSFPSVVVSLPTGGEFVIGANSTQDPANFSPYIKAAENKVISYGGGLLLGAYDSGGSESAFLNANAQSQSDDGAFFAVNDSQSYLGLSTKRWREAYATTFFTGDGTVKWTSGSGSPEGVVTAVVGSLYSRTDGGAGTSFYVKESGTGATGWAAK